MLIEESFGKLFIKNSLVLVRICLVKSVRHHVHPNLIFYVLNQKAVTLQQNILSCQKSYTDVRLLRLCWWSLGNK